jgi:predicted acylesterase/phospholipase RssA
VKGDIHDDCFIWQACRATSAAPFLFPPVEIGRHSTQYVDGAFAGNNPTKLAKTQAFEIWGSGVRVDALVSIGTGVRPLVDVGNKHKGIIKTLADIATETEETAGQIKDELEQQGLAHTYFRFNVDRGLESVGLDEWNQNSRVMTVTAKYVQSHKEDFKRCVKQIHDPACK